MKTTTNQQKAIEHNSGNMIVSASAGSGKTFVVINRIIRLITKQNVSVSEILAVTFTNLAASEMKEKLKTAIIKEINESNNAENEARLKNELDLVNGADISTIHSFCLNLLKRYFYAINLDATFEICDESKGKRLKAQALDNAFEKMYESNDELFLTALDVFGRGRNDQKLKKAVADSASFIEAEADVSILKEKTKSSSENVLEILNGFLKNYYQKRYAVIKNKVSKIKDYFEGVSHRLVQIELLIKMLDNAINANNFNELYEAVKFPKVERKNVSKGDEYAKLLKGYHEEFENLSAEVIEIGEKPQEDIIAEANESYNGFLALMHVYEEYYKEYALLKREENLVDFADLEHFTYKLLQNEEICAEVKNKYKYIFIDEYQDVNGVQEEIIKLLSSDNEFMVGDSKQSIYAFRGCNPTFFTKKIKLYEGKQGGEATSLDENFRSSESIINTVNNVFSRVMTADFGGNPYANKKMVYGGLYNDSETNQKYSGRAVIDVIDNDVDKNKKEIKPGVYSVMNDDAYKKEEIGAEEKLVLNLINQAIGTPFYDIKLDPPALRPINYGDIVILMRSLGDLGESIVNVLVKAGIPVSAETKNSIGDYPEIKTLVNLIKLITCANQDIPLANVLLEFWNLTELDLATIRESTDAYCDFYTATQLASEIENDLGNSLKEFFKYLDKIRILAEFSTAGEVLHRVISDTSWETKILSSALGEIKMRRIERFITASGTLSIREFADHLEETLEDISVSEASGENTVKIMTMHASKGLEFPFVIIAGANKDFNMQDTKGFYLKDRDWGYALKTIDRSNSVIKKSVLHTALNKKIREQSVIEEIRIFYVALTRAKYELHVIVDKENFTEDKKYIGDLKNFASLLTISDAEINEYSASQLTINDVEEGQIVAGKEKSVELSSLIKRNLNLKYNYDKDTLLPVKSSVSSLNANTEQEYYKTVSIFGESDAEKGTAYHKALELINFYMPVEKQFESLVKSGAFTQTEKDLIDLNLLNKIVKLSVFDKIKNYKLYKEVKFCSLINPNSLGMDSTDAEILVQGIVDLIAVNGNDAILIDYKLSKIANEEDIIKKYRRQMWLYKTAIEKSLNLTVNETYLVNILQGKIIKVDV